MKKYKVYKDSGVEWIGEIPRHWEVSKFKYVSEIVTGNTPSKKEEELYYSTSKHGINWVKPADLNPSLSYVMDTKEYLTEEGKKKARTIPKNSTMICCIGNTIGKHSIAGKKMTTNQQINSVIVNDKVDAFYCLFYVNVFTKDLLKWANYVTLPIYTKADLEDTPFLLPSSCEQVKIATYLNHKTQQIDQLLALKEQKIALLQEKRTALINQAVTKGLDPTVKMKDSGVEWIGEIPEHWEVRRVKYLFKLGKGLTITKANLKEKGVPCVNYGEIHSKYGFELDENKHSLKYVDVEYRDSNPQALIDPGDFVFADTSEDIEGCGNFTYLKSDKEIFAGYHTVVVRPNLGLNSRFFAYEFNSDCFRNQVRTKVKGVKVYSITQTILKALFLCIPPAKEQQQIVTYLDQQTQQIDQSIQQEQQKIALLKEYKQTLISNAVTGKIRVCDQDLSTSTNPSTYENTYRN